MMARLAFFGTPEFSLPALEATSRFAREYNHDLVMVVTQPDAHQDRGKMLLPSAVKKGALKLGIPVLQPSNLRKENSVGDDFYEAFINAHIDLAIVVAYGKIITKRLLASSRLGFINIHGSKLPRFRGAAPVQRAIEAGDRETGVCLMAMNEKLDEGDIFATRTTPIIASDNTFTLLRRLSYMGASLLYEKLGLLLENNIPKIAQDTNGILYAAMINKEEGMWNNNSPASLIAHRARAFDPWPSLYGFINGMRVKLFDSFFINTKKDRDKIPGTIVVLSQFLGIRSLDGIVYFQTIQFENKRRVAIKDVLSSQKIKIGDQIKNFLE
jgi:methionyl-tRNA formyltransferase